MKLADAKRLLLEVMAKEETVHYRLGWLKESYITGLPKDVEAAVVISSLSKYGIEVEIEEN